MPKFNVDDEKGLYDPIEITLEGKEYRIEKITTDMMDAVTKDAKDNSADDIGVLCRQLAIFIGGDPEDYRGIDIRKIGAVLKFITDEVRSAIEGMKPKNG